VAYVHSELVKINFWNLSHQVGLPTASFQNCFKSRWEP